jgi:hypothetical protein
MKPTENPRRHFLRLGATALTLIPILAASGQAHAATNAAMRTSLKYQDKPEGDKRCATCLQFLPGKTAKDHGGCKLMPGDTEIAANGYCVAWSKKN